MQIIIKVLIGVMILVGVLLVFSPKKKKNFMQSDRPARAIVSHTYYYYPKANFYYDSTEAKYILWDSTAAVWKKTDKLPVQQIDLGKRVRIGQATEPVWTENPHHKLIYSVFLYSGPEDFKKDKKSDVGGDSEKSNTAIKPEKAEKKRGVRKFFERIFSSRKKKDNS